MVTLTNRYLPEGHLLNTPENEARCASAAALQRAMEHGEILEGTAILCSAGHDLLVQAGPFQGYIPREEAALGISDGSTREIAILSRVGKPVCFVVEGLEGDRGALRPRLSRRKAQQLALDALLAELVPGQVILAQVTHLEPFGAFVDIGCGVSSMIGIENISVSRIPHPSARFSVGQRIFAAVLDLDRQAGRVYLTHKELLGTWAENAGKFQSGMTVPGIIRGLKDYGAFVELTPNLSGLAEIKPGLAEGDRVSVYLKAILPDRMKIKLLAIDRLPPLPEPPPLEYFITEGKLEKWKYAPQSCTRLGAETIFAG